MKIGVTCYPTYGGSGVLATELGIEMAKRGHDIHFITSDVPFRLQTFNEHLFFHGVEVMTYPVFDHSPYSLALSARMAEIAEMEDLDILHVHYAIPHAPAAYLAKQMVRKNKRLKDLKIITTLHGTDITLLSMDRSFQNLIRFSIDESDGTTAVSKYLRNKTYAEIHPSQTIKVIHNFVDPEKYKPRSPDKPICSSFINRIAPAGEKILMHISNFRPIKRVPDILKVFEMTRSAVKSKLVLIGDGPERNLVSQMAKDLNIDHDVIFLGKLDAVSDIICMADVFLLLSETESFGLAALEAMSAGVPVVTTDVGGLPEVNIQGVTGYLEPLGQIDSAARDVIKILSNDELREKIGMHARQRVLDHFTTDKIVSQYEDYYFKIADQQH